MAVMIKRRQKRYDCLDRHEWKWYSVYTNNQLSFIEALYESKTYGVVCHDSKRPGLGLIPTADFTLLASEGIMSC